MSKKDEADRSESADQAIVEYLEGCLAAAREGRVLFVVASVGLVSPRVVGEGEQRGPDRFSVAVGVFAGERAAELHPLARQGAVDDVCRGAALSASKLRETVPMDGELS